MNVDIITTPTADVTGFVDDIFLGMLAHHCPSLEELSLDNPWAKDRVNTTDAAATFHSNSNSKSSNFSTVTRSTALPGTVFSAPFSITQLAEGNSFCLKPRILSVGFPSNRTIQSAAPAVNAPGSVSAKVRERSVAFIVRCMAAECKERRRVGNSRNGGYSVPALGAGVCKSCDGWRLLGDPDRECP